VTTGEPQPRRVEATQLDLAYLGRVLRVIASAEFKLKYADSILGYAWSLIKPLAIFAVLYVVFGRFFKLELGFSHYPLYLLIGIVLWMFFLDATTVTMGSIVAQGALLRKISFPRIIIPLSATLTAGLTFAVNLLAISAFLAANRIAPRAEWLLVIPLFAELYVFTLGLGLILTTLFAAFRDTGQLWDLVAQVLFYASPIIYPVGFLPPWAQPIAFLSPFVEVIQDARRVVLGASERVHIDVAADVYGGWWGHLLPAGVAVLVLLVGLAVFRRASGGFAEQV
jgi:ABC-2 type transport system permease protein